MPSRFALFLLLSIFCFSSCSDDTLTVEEQFAKDIQEIENYLSANNLVAEKTVHGVYYIIDVPGDENKPKITSTVIANYKGYFLDGTVFDAGNNIDFPLYGVIQGWQIGIPKFGKGGKGKLLIPSKLGYGTNSNPGRANAVLIFDIELIDFN